MERRATYQFQQSPCSEGAHIKANDPEIRDHHFSQGIIHFISFKKMPCKIPLISLKSLSK